jgi:DnaJ family protein C protein 2
MQKKSQFEFLNKKVTLYVEKKDQEAKQKMNRNILTEWSEKDIELFKKGCQKYPSGTEGRYRRIALYMKTKHI